MSKFRERLEAASDAIKDAAFKATDPLVRCPARKNGLRCQLSKGREHRGRKHEKGSVKW